MERKWSAWEQHFFLEINQYLPSQIRCPSLITWYLILRAWMAVFSHLLRWIHLHFVPRTEYVYTGRHPVLRSRPNQPALDSRFLTGLKKIPNHLNFYAATNGKLIYGGSTDWGEHVPIRKRGVKVEPTVMTKPPTSHDEKPLHNSFLVTFHWHIPPRPQGIIKLMKFC